jgi:hypothetical protein
LTLILGVVVAPEGMLPKEFEEQVKPQAGSSRQEVLAGVVERVTFHNADNGFCVLRAKARGHRNVVTVIGHAATCWRVDHGLRRVGE